MPRVADDPYFTLPSERYPSRMHDRDRGLDRTTDGMRDDGRFRVPTRVRPTSPYAHDGYFRRLDEMIRFHAVARIAPEVPATVDLIAFLQTLTDARE